MMETKVAEICQPKLCAFWLEHAISFAQVLASGCDMPSLHFNDILLCVIVFVSSLIMQLICTISYIF
jgi:hypothetical protein